MKNNLIKRPAEYLPKIIADRIDELAEQSSGYKNLRFDNYLKITGTIYYKCLKENGNEFQTYPMSKKYWRKIIGGKYTSYLKELLNAKIITVEKRGNRLYYGIEIEWMFSLDYYKIKRVLYRTMKNKMPGQENVQSILERNRIEIRLGKRILNNLNKISVDFEAFTAKLKREELGINPNNFLIDISEFPENMNFKASIHYPNGIITHNYKVKSLLKISKELGLPIYYDKDRIRIIDSTSYKQLKERSLKSHSNLNLMKLRDGHYELSRDESKTRRIFHVGVFLPSKALQFVKINGMPVMGIDATTSQFQLLANIFNSYINTGNSVADNFSGKRKTFIKELYQIFESIESKSQKEKDVGKFYDDVLENDFYEVIRQELNLSHRNQAKIFCFSIIFSKPDSKNKFKQIIRERYPVVIDALDSFKRKFGYEKLAINLQALEAEIFIDGIFNELNKKGIHCFTRHDSVVVGNNNMEKAKNIAENYFRKLGFTPKFKVEDYSPSEEIHEEDEGWNAYFSEQEIEFIHDINDINDINHLSREQLETLIEIGKYYQTINESEYNYLTGIYSELNWLENLDQYSIELFYKISNEINEMIYINEMQLS